MEIFTFNKQFKECSLEVSDGSEKQTVELQFGQRYNVKTHRIANLKLDKLFENLDITTP